jgi:hypothetical protein
VYQSPAFILSRSLAATAILRFASLQDGRCENSTLADAITPVAVLNAFRVGGNRQAPTVAGVLLEKLSSEPHRDLVTVVAKLVETGGPNDTAPGPPTIPRRGSARRRLMRTAAALRDYAAIVARFH